MEKKTLVICDPEAEYAKSLSHFLMGKKELLFQIQICSDVLYVLKLQEELDIDLLLISDEFRNLEEARKAFRKVRTKNLIWLSGHNNYQDKNRIFKYQSGDAFYGAFIKCCQNLLDVEEIYARNPGRGEGKVFAVFSPVNRVGKTEYALELGKKLAREQNVLYLNMEIFGGVDGYFDENCYTMTDLLYYARQEQGNMGLFLQESVGHLEQLHYISPAKVSEDVKAVRGLEWKELIERLLSESIYDVLLLDVSDGIRDLYDVLMVCDEIYMLSVNDPAAVSKVKQFETEMSLMKLEGLNRKIKRVVRGR